MKNLIIVLSLLCSLMSFTVFAQHGAGAKGKVLLIVSNPAVSKQTGWPIGVWAAEVVHPYWAFVEAGYAVDIVSPDGGEVKWDGYSDPEDASQYSAFDFLSLGFKKDASKMALLKNTRKLSDVNPDDYKSIFVCGGQGPMYTFIDNAPLHDFFTKFYLTGKPTAAICHGTCILLKTKLPNGKFLVDGKRWTGFASAEEQYADNYVGMKIQPFRIEDEARKMANSRFEVGLPFASHAVRDGNLITGQQQNSGASAARLVIEQLEKGRSKYPTYVLVHGAFANDMAWDAVRTQLALRANVVSLDLPGHGLDYTTLDKITLAAYVKAVTQLINRQPSKVILVGHSMAGVVISQVAENIPKKISKLVYVSAYLPKNGQTLQDLAQTDKESLVGQNFEFAPDYSTATIKKDKLVEAIAADVPKPVQEALVKYHMPEPLKPFNEKVLLTPAKFGSIPKYYIETTQDHAVTPALQERMIAANGQIKKVYKMNTSHLPFVANPGEFVQILSSIK